MKLAIRIFAFVIVVAGVAAAAITPKTAPVIPSHQSASATFADSALRPDGLPGAAACASPSSSQVAAKGNLV